MFLSCAIFFTDSVCVAMSMCVRSLTFSFEKWRAFPSLRTSVSPTNRMELLTRKDMEPEVARSCESLYFCPSRMDNVSVFEQRVGLLKRSIIHLSLIHISEPTRRTPISYAVFCLKK